jgi:hypothetical protein
MSCWVELFGRVSYFQPSPKQENFFASKDSIIGKGFNFNPLEFFGDNEGQIINEGYSKLS